MGKVKLLILDFDGTLADTLPHVFNCITKCIKKYGLKQFSEEERKRFSGSFLEKILQELGATEEQIPAIKEYYSNVFLEDVSDIILLDGVKDTLKGLKECGYTIAIASNRGRNTIEPLIQYLKLDGIFKKIVCATDVVNKKPHPEMLNIILNDLGYDKSEALMVGDTKADIILGKNAGVKTCLLSPSNSFDDGARAFNPEFVITKFSDLKNIVNN